MARSTDVAHRVEEEIRGRVQVVEVESLAKAGESGLWAPGKDTEGSGLVDIKWP